MNLLLQKLSILQWGSITFCILFLYSCASEKPEKTDLEASVENQFKGQVIADFKSLERINGVVKTIDGYETYTVFYNGDVQLTPSKENRNDFFENVWGSGRRIMRDTIYLPIIYRITNGSAMFIKTENGWNPYKNDFGTMTVLEERIKNEPSMKQEAEKIVSKAHETEEVVIRDSSELKPYKVTSEQSFFYRSPTESSKRKAFVQKDDIVQVYGITLEGQTGWAYSIYTNSNNVKTVGYLKFSDLILFTE